MKLPDDISKELQSTNQCMLSKMNSDYKLYTLHNSFSHVCVFLSATAIHSIKEKNRG